MLCGELCNKCIINRHKFAFILLFLIYVDISIVAMGGSYHSLYGCLVLMHFLFRLCFIVKWSLLAYLLYIYSYLVVME